MPPEILTVKILSPYGIFCNLDFNEKGTCYCVRLGLLEDVDWSYKDVVIFSDHSNYISSKIKGYLQITFTRIR